MAAIPSFHLYDEDLAYQFILSLRQVLNGLTDAQGNALPVSIAAAWRDDLAQLPEVMVSAELGDDVMGMGFGAATVDASGNTIYLARHPQSIVSIKVRARSDQERRYIVGALRSALRFAYMVPTPAAATAGVYEAAIRQQLGGMGIFIDRIYKATYPQIDLAGPRPDGLICEASIRIDCTVEISVVGSPGAVVPTSISISQTAHTSDGLFGIDVTAADASLNILP